jgi:glucokinase
MRVLGRARTPVDSRGPADVILSTLAGCILAHAGSVELVQIAGVAFAFPGPFEYDTGVCRIAGVHKYESLYDLSIGAELSRRTGLSRFSFVNAAEAAIAGEIGYGAARGYVRVIGVTLGTGIGSGFFVHGRRQSAGPGVPANGGWLFDERFDGAMADDCFSIRGLVDRLGQAGVTSPEPEAAARAARWGDPGTRAVFERFGCDLGRFLRPYVTAFGADGLFVGGGLSGAFDLFGRALQEGLEVPVLRGTLGADAPLLGATETFLGKFGWTNGLARAEA